MELIKKYFPKLTDRQLERLAALDPLYRTWNERINVISRKDIDNLYLHHVLHSMTVSQLVSFKAGAHILDLGTGGGFPGIPLAILYPDTRFVLLDGTRKKISVVQAIVEALQLDNVTALQQRAEEWKGDKFDFVVTRAVAPLDKLVAWSFPLLHQQHQHALPNGLIALKGGAVAAEVKSLLKGNYAEVEAILPHFKQPFFEEKYLVYVQR